jgi:2-oxoglutarate ferredoxin oxidoreductase subunit alpha
MDRLARKFETARQHVPKPAVVHADGATIGIIGYGTSHWAIDESRAQLEREFGVRTGYLRLRAYPFSAELDEFIDRYERIYVVEQNRDAQMLALMRLDIAPERSARLRSVLHYSGLPLDARSVTDAVERQEGLKERPRPDRLVSAGAGER